MLFHSHKAMSFHPMLPHSTVSVPLRRTIPCWCVLKSLIKCKADERKMPYSSFRPLYLCTFASVRVTRTSKAMQTTAIRTVAKSLPQNEVVLLTLLISDRYILFAILRNIFAVQRTVAQSSECSAGLYRQWN